ncbi:cupin domain-containing protein [Rhizobium sp. ERR 942]|uniref:cupin domain-containing protein n=2 Tax=unclassified Rhizobium TaxID=2613769 RepID=UPI001AEF3428|nr:cupin domain-containing protein [Rhizobium sp. ERR 942]
MKSLSPMRYSMLKPNVYSILSSVAENSAIPSSISMTLGTVAVLALFLGITNYRSGEADPGPAQHHMSETSDPAAAGRPQTTVRPISCEPLPNVPGKSLTVAVVDYPPNAYTPRHRHPGSVSAFVLKGTLRSQLEGGPAGTYRAGETWFEPPGTAHLFAENVSKTEPAELLATFVADSDCGPLVIPD